MSLKLRLIFILILSFSISLLITYIYSGFSKDRYLSTIKLSTLYSTESVVLQTIRMRIGFDAMDNAVQRFSQKLNDEIYSPSSVCGEINIINNVMPVIISNSRNNIKIEIVTNNKELLDSCRDYVINQIKIENSRIIEFFKSLLKINNNSLNLNMNKNIDVDQFINYYNKYKQLLSNKINITDQEIDEYLSMWIMRLIPSQIDEELERTEDSLENLKFFTLVSDNTKIQKSIDIKIIFMIFFIFSFLVLVLINKISRKKVSSFSVFIEKILS